VRTIYLVNKSTLLSASDLNAAAGALAYQAQYHFAPWWGMSATTRVAVTVPLGAEAIYLTDTIEVADALGYHDLASGKTPVGFVAVKTTLDAGDKVSATLSHEFLEMLLDPWIYSTVNATWQSKAAALAQEACDPVENDEYQINGVWVSNFILPGWFMPGLTHVDYMQTLKTALTLRPGGYQSYTTDLANWQQTFGDKPRAHQLTPEKYSRRHRRIAAHLYRKAA
jgi:hypothetical protein